MSHPKDLDRGSSSCARQRRQKDRLVMLPATLTEALRQLQLAEAFLRILRVIELDSPGWAEANRRRRGASVAPAAGGWWLCSRRQSRMMIFLLRLRSTAAPLRSGAVPLARPHQDQIGRGYGSTSRTYWLLAAAGSARLEAGRRGVTRGLLTKG